MGLDPRRQFGNEGEEFAAGYLEEHGMQVLGAQVRTRFGEIDLVCLDGTTVAFVEVKSRRTATYGHPEAAITAEKFSHMARAAEAYLQERGWTARPWRLDVVAVEWQEDVPRVTHFPGIDSPSQNW